MFVALAGVVLAAAVFLPWFKATVTIRGMDGDVSGVLMDPPGTLGGLAAHWYLLVPLTVALLEVAVIVARNFPGRRAPRLPFHTLSGAVSSPWPRAYPLVGAAFWLYASRADGLLRHVYAAERQLRGLFRG